MSVLGQAEGGMAVPELCREHGISAATFYKWLSKFGGMDVSMMTKMMTMQDENRNCGDSAFNCLAAHRGVEGCA